MTLRQARCAFAPCIASLIQKAVALGFECALDEGMDRLTTKDPTSDHMRNSVHNVGLAQDLLLYRDGTYLTRTEDYQPLGEWWETQHTLARWGGRFSHRDGNHFSFEWEGRR
jgi:hypothetical protein